MLNSCILFPPRKFSHTHLADRKDWVCYFFIFYRYKKRKTKNNIQHRNCKFSFQIFCLGCSNLSSWDIGTTICLSFFIFFFLNGCLIWTQSFSWVSDNCYTCPTVLASVLLWNFCTVLYSAVYLGSEIVSALRLLQCLCNFLA